MANFHFSPKSSSCISISTLTCHEGGEGKTSNKTSIPLVKMKGKGGESGGVYLLKVIDHWLDQAWMWWCLLDISDGKNFLILAGRYWDF